VLAGSAGTDPAGRVAYVKTVQPGSVEPGSGGQPVVVDRGITSRDVVYPAGGNVSVSGGDISGPSAPAAAWSSGPSAPAAAWSSGPSAPAAAWSSNDASYEDSGTAVVKHMVISADINTDQVSAQCGHCGQYWSLWSLCLMWSVWSVC